MRNRRLWIVWVLLTALVSSVFAASLLYKRAATLPGLSSAREFFLPGRTTHGHHQIELACESCHTKPFGGGEVLQEACVNCHGDALAQAGDKHPAGKFNDPRNVFRLEKIDAQKCVTCHVEHRPAITSAMGVTQPRDFCFHCHSGKDEMPPDHTGFKFDGCNAAGCHKYHDNRALYEEFLLKHAGEPALLPKRTLPTRSLKASLEDSAAYPRDRYPMRPLEAASADAPPGRPVDPQIHKDWLGTAHARAGVNCSACHVVGAALAADAPRPPDAGRWVDRPATPQACQGCHALETQGFLSGEHGMRLAQGLSPMTPGQAQLPMRPEASHDGLSCVSCHSAHRFDAHAAAVESCLGCHDDSHTLAYKRSPHYELWRKEVAGELPPGSGVSCASCHMPRMRMVSDDGKRMAVQHNQNDTLQPNEKMIRPVCLACHGLGFSIDALADQALVERNFKGQPSRHVPSIDMAVRSDAQRAASGAGP